MPLGTATMFHRGRCGRGQDRGSGVRRLQLGVRLGGLSLPLDIGYSETIRQPSAAR